MENRKSTEEKLGYVDYRNDTEMNLALKYFDWKFYSERNGRHLKTQAEVLGYLEKLGFSYKTLNEKWKEEQYKYAKRSDYNNLVKEYEKTEDGLPF
jgi:hypothetical protein